MQKIALGMGSLAIGSLAAMLAAGAASGQPAPRVSASDALAAAPKAQISNGVLRATLLLPDAKRGFYRATRFDWAGLVASLTYQGQEYYGLWFDQMAPDLRDYVFQDGSVVAGPNTAVMGPAEAFDASDPPGYKDAAPGGLFLKIGVGVLRKPADGGPYDSFKLYDIVDGGAWSAKAGRDRVDFTHTLSNAATGYGYVYSKTVRLVAGQPRMVIEHRLRNTGSKPIATSMFNHNFLTLGGSPVAAGLTVETPYALSTPRAPRSDAGRIEGSRVVYGRALPDGESFAMPLTGFGSAAADSRFSVTAANGAGYSAVGDRPLASLYLWSIRPTVAVEPYVALAVAPGETVAWTSTYTYTAPRR